MTLFIFISLFLFVVYITGIILVFGIPASISDSYYLLESKKRNLGSLFTLMMFSVGIFIIAPMIEITPENWEFLPFLSIAGICFVGSAPLFKRNNTDTFVHFYGAGSAAIFSLTWLFICYPENWVSLIEVIILTGIGVFLSKRRFKETYVFWAEIVLFLTIYISLFKIIN